MMFLSDSNTKKTTIVLYKNCVLTCLGRNQWLTEWSKLVDNDEIDVQCYNELRMYDCYIHNNMDIVWIKSMEKK